MASRGSRSSRKAVKDQRKAAIDQEEALRLACVEWMNETVERDRREREEAQQRIEDMLRAEEEKREKMAASRHARTQKRKFQIAERRSKIKKREPIVVRNGSIIQTGLPVRHEGARKIVDGKMYYRDFSSDHDQYMRETIAATRQAVNERERQKALQSPSSFDLDQQLQQQREKDAKAANQGEIGKVTFIQGRQIPVESGASMEGAGD